MYTHPSERDLHSFRREAHLCRAAPEKDEEVQLKICLIMFLMFDVNDQMLGFGFFSNYFKSWSQRWEESRGCSWSCRFEDRLLIVVTVFGAWHLDFSNLTTSANEKAHWHRNKKK